MIVNRRAKPGPPAPRAGLPAAVVQAGFATGATM